MTSEASELALRLYYFGCSTAISRLEQGASSREDRDEAADSATRVAGGWAIGAAQWLYLARQLRPPHDDPKWAAWYAGVLAARGGWTLVACVGASRAESDRCVVPRRPPTLFPAWGLAVSVARKHAVLTVRGSTTRADWVINSDLEPVAFKGGRCHRGMLLAARAVLDDCGARRLVDALLARGFNLTLVGHSLGAGVAVIIAALLDRVDRVDCVAYATPACVSPDLADALRPRVLTVVHRDDLVPRLSDANCAVLARDLVADDADYKRRLAADKLALAEHLKTLGKANAMAPPANDAPSPRAPVAADVPRADDRLVVPGRILYLDTLSGSYRARLGDHRSLAEHLDRVVVSSRAVEDHHIEAHLNALRQARWANDDLPPPRPRPPFQPAVDPRNAAYVPCAVCGSNTTWTSIAPGSDSARAAATHHCRACGAVVCAFCAPAADLLATDGLGQTIQLPDRRLSLPAVRFFTPVRVCHPCAFQAFDS
mmetsp:Transcript_9579/g.30663  ORF Transcript_9579/g.30663 Transcript_9579/m.30663 type:complete len:485 (+) Transcript_9579:244-1698(+)